ncbi:MAG TPA: acyl-CoA dehydrogenase family protein [Acidimicrobiales bacterium]|jgi:alkylation response protein AidB-like acyl-CoA dehydrogenase
MDFTLDDEQQAISELADRILAEQCPVETLRTLEAGPADQRLAADAWAALAGADLLGLALDEDHGGSGLDLIAAGMVAQQVGRHVTLVPYWSSTAAALTIARWGSDEIRARWLPGALDGTAPLAVALWNAPGTEGLTAVADADADGWRLTGTATPVPWAGQAKALVVTAQFEAGGSGVFVVDTDLPGLKFVDETVITNEPNQTVHFSDVRLTGVDQLGDETVASWLAQRSAALLCLTALGVCEEALALTARHVTERHQFGSPIGTFQAVGHRCADSYIDTEAIRLTALQAIWQLDAGWDASDALAVATFWATEGGQRVVHAAQHLHGGIGMDTDYPLHRYFRWAKWTESLLGGTNGALLRLGRSLAAGAAPTT